jgi:anti-anti-sigma factor
MNTDVGSAGTTRLGSSTATVDESGRDVMWLHGEHDRLTVDALTSELDRIIAMDHADVIVDLSDVQFLGVAPLRALAEAEDRLAGQHRTLVLRAPSRCAQRVIDLCAFGSQRAPGLAQERTVSVGPTRLLRTWVAVPLAGWLPDVEALEAWSLLGEEPEIAGAGTAHVDATVDAMVDAMVDAVVAEPAVVRRTGP